MWLGHFGLGLERKDDVAHNSMRGYILYFDGLERKDEVVHIYCIFIDGLERKDEVVHIYCIKFKL